MKVVGQGGNNDVIFMKADDDSKWCGSVKVATWARAIRLIGMPTIGMENSADTSRPAGPYYGTPEFPPMVLSAVADKGLISGLKNCFSGINMGKLTIYQCIAANGDGEVVKPLTETSLEDTFMNKVHIVFHNALDQSMGHSVHVYYTIVANKIQQVRNLYDEKMANTGKHGAFIDRNKLASGAS